MCWCVCVCSKKVKVEVWDTSGQPAFEDTLPSFLKVKDLHDDILYRDYIFIHRYCILLY